MVRPWCILLVEMQRDDEKETTMNTTTKTLTTIAVVAGLVVVAWVCPWAIFTVLAVSAVACGYQSR